MGKLEVVRNFAFLWAFMPKMDYETNTYAEVLQWAISGLTPIRNYANKLKLMNTLVFPPVQNRTESRTIRKKKSI